MAFSIAGAEIRQKCGNACWEGVWFFLDPWYVVGLRTTSGVWNVSGKCGPRGEHLFFLIKKEPFAFTKAVDFKSFLLAETLGVCALIGLLLMAAEGAPGSSGSQ